MTTSLSNYDCSFNSFHIFLMILIERACTSPTTKSSTKIPRLSTAKKEEVCSTIITTTITCPKIWYQVYSILVAIVLCEIECSIATFGEFYILRNSEDGTEAKQQ